MLTLVETDGVIAVYQDEVLLGHIWQLHEEFRPSRRIRSGTFRSWASETVAGDRSWHSTQEDAVASLDS